MIKQVEPSYILEQRRLGWPDIHPEDYCHRCGVSFDPWFTDRETWLAGTSVWSKETGREGICCMTCFTDMYKANTGKRPCWNLNIKNF